MKRHMYFLLLAAMVSGLTACKKDDPNGLVTLNLSHKVDGATLLMDSIMYVNAAGDTFSVTNLKYYISGVVLTREDNGTETFEGPFYVDQANASTLSHELGEIPVANYTSIRFFIGLDSAHNITGSLPATNANNNMAWPDPMGGGYHFLKLEGYYNNPSPTQTGFAMHLGKNANLVTCTINNLAFETDEEGSDLNLVMNINEWFRNPANYDFNTDGVSIMMNDASMLKLATNGADVFTKE